MTDPGLESRLIELESRSMHQERLIDELNGIVIEQRKLLNRLAAELDRLKSQVQAGTADPGGHDEKPPHY